MMQVPHDALLHLRRDPVLCEHIDSIILPLRSPPSDVYSGLVSSIIGQQLSVKAAATIHDRFTALFDHGYPHAAQLLALRDEEIRGAGISRQKMGYLRNVAQYFLDADLFGKDWMEHSDEEIIALLTQIKGVGRWTAEMILIFVLFRPDVLPIMDLGIQQGVAKAYGLTSQKSVLHEEIMRIAERWRPYRSYACLYLWEL